MTAKLNDDKALARMGVDRNHGGSLQSTEPLQVTLFGQRDSRGLGDILPPLRVSNSRSANYLAASARECADATASKPWHCDHLAEVRCDESGENARRKRESAIATSTLVRWLRFNFVGGIGILVQFFALFLLKSVLQLDYLVATALAVEAAVVHNFLWHERYTWADRVQPSGRRSLARLARFNITNGGVSIVGNLALMKVVVGMGHMNYLLANGIAITMCSLANFLVSETWVFGADEPDQPSEMNAR